MGYSPDCKNLKYRTHKRKHRSKTSGFILYSTKNQAIKVTSRHIGVHQLKKCVLKDSFMKVKRQLVEREKIFLTYVYPH